MRVYGGVDCVFEVELVVAPVVVDEVVSTGSVTVAGGTSLVPEVFEMESSASAVTLATSSNKFGTSSSLFSRSSAFASMRVAFATTMGAVVVAKVTVDEDIKTGTVELVARVLEEPERTNRAFVSMICASSASNLSEMDCFNSSFVMTPAVSGLSWDSIKTDTALTPVFTAADSTSATRSFASSGMDAATSCNSRTTSYFCYICSTYIFS